MEITPIGGTDEIGKNMTVLSLGDTNLIVDMGVKMDSVVNSGNESISSLDRNELINLGGIPDDSKIQSKNISGIILTHGHLDHIGAIGKLASNYEAPIYSTPFTSELVKKVIREEKVFNIKNEIKEIDPGKTVEIENLQVEFIPGAHSIPQNSFPAIHSKEGVVLCVGGFKIENSKMVGLSTDYKSLEHLKDEGPVISLICSVKADEPNPTPPESHAKEMLKEVMKKASERGKGLFVTAFSSHIARIKTIVEISYKVDRKPIILGKSLRDKCKIAYELGLTNFPSKLKILGHIQSIRKALKVINKRRDGYVVITTGHQGEQNSILSRIADGKEPYKVKPKDEIIFSASIIPNPANKYNRKLLEAKLKAQGANIHRDIHVSGHAGKPGTKELIEKIGPDHIVPFHGTKEKMKSVIDIGQKEGYSKNQLHMMRNGETLRLGA